LFYKLVLLLVLVLMASTCRRRLFFYICMQLVLLQLRLLLPRPAASKHRQLAFIPAIAVNFICCHIQ
jgi:hypothetical protein